MTTTCIRRKLIEVALPLDAINASAAREKSIRHGHPSTLHLWWARRPLAAARAVIFAQMVDDPLEYVDVLLSDAAKKRAAQRALKKRRAGQSHADSTGQGDRQELAEIATEFERERLFKIIEELVLWENTNNGGSAGACSDGDLAELAPRLRRERRPSPRERDIRPSQAARIP